MTVDWNKDKVKLNVFEGERLFEGILVGRTAEEMHWITPRICGVCPVAHNIASLKAVEDALDIKVSETTRQLRDLMACGQIIQSHSLHLFFLSLPDYLGIDRGTELAQKNPAAFKKALALKEVSDEIVQTVGGRNVHPTTTAIGGFHKVPTKVQLKKLLKKLAETATAARDTVELCLGLDYPELKVDLKLAALVNDKIAAVSSNNIAGR
ncbi:MAG: Ni/Fe hydrogenase subunit alpha, partial [Candidatus Portnoybacteria bacterium CG23_combo_of_CG06-09_8_20_14_all_44_36]